ncbi:ATP-binding protein [Cognatiluteimonas profundi]|uniref:ATP-binding protein n=1 Tax=Cognatiluteimonas profundi TaxID=2594501 RepID=UPI00131EAAA3|nr:winged helix-turn-helix domain-containing protein [Lysobacter profundi]
MSPGSGIYEFGEFRLEPDEARLTRRGQVVILEPKAMEVLGRMLEQPGHLHERDELLDAVWGHRHVTPSALNRVVTLLRQALGDRRDSPRYIETVPRRGYRFIAAVRNVEQVQVGSPQPMRGPFNPPPLPSPIGSDVPRDAELATLQRLLGDVRLLTLNGPGGIGKTRLALHLARRCEGDYPDGVWLVDLTACRNGAEVAEALLAAFGFVRQGEASNAALLVEALLHRRLLLLLDNCDRVAGQVAMLAAPLLQRCPGLRILTTSQVRLGVEGEQAYRVPPLELPPDDWDHADAPLAAARSSNAVRLLEMRAREADPGFELDAGNIAAVVRLCRYLEGLPLALELAATRLRVLGPAELLERLSARREVLVSDLHGGPDRQHSVREMLDWSFDLLSPAEAELLQRLTLFSSGWTLEGAEAVMTDASGKARDIVGPLGSLIDKSFVIVEHDAVPRRFRMLQAVRDYAGERLRSDCDANVYRLRQLRHYIALTASADAVLYDRPTHRYGGLLDREQPNIRSAFDFALEHGLADEALQLALNLRWYWWVIGSFRTAREWIGRALEAHPSPTLVARAKALQFIGLMELHLSRAEAEPLLEEAVALTARAELPREHGMALAGLAMLRVASGRYPEARRMLAHAMRRAIEAGDMHVRAYARIWITAMHSTVGEYRLASISARCAVSELRAFWLERNSGPGFLLGFAEVNCGLQALMLGDPTAAAQAFERTLSLSATLRNLRMSAAALEGFAYVLATRGQQALGARLLGGAQRLRELTGVPMSRHWQDAHRHVWEAMRRGLGEADAERLFQAGRHDRQQHLQSLLYAAYPSIGLAANAIASPSSPNNPG